MYYFTCLSHIVDGIVLPTGMRVWVVCTHTRTRLPDGHMMLPIYVPAGRNIIPYPSPYLVKPVGYSGFGYPLPSLVTAGGHDGGGADPRPEVGDDPDLWAPPVSGWPKKKRRRGAVGPAGKCCWAAWAG
jgi:hypothetical protein